MPGIKSFAWLLESDPVIRWQVLADLLADLPDAQADVVARERSRLLSEGWCASLLALNNFQAAGAPRDDHLQPAIDLLVSKRRSDGTWNLGRRHPGKVFFEMETSSQPSKWNTLRALRVLRWWQAE